MLAVAGGILIVLILLGASLLGLGMATGEAGAENKGCGCFILVAVTAVVLWLIF